MPRPAWNEITARAAKFAADWAGESYEKGEAQSFWTEFLALFDIDRRRAGGYFEYAVKLAGKKYGFIDMFLPGKLIVEQKSAGRDLGAAQGQALGYLDGIPDHDLPLRIVACDFQTFQLYDTETRAVSTFTLAELPKHVREFGFLVDEQALRVEEQSPVNREAAERMAKLHNLLYDSGYVGHNLELFLVRLVFCHFADDARIFEPSAFEKFIRNRTSLDGTDLGPRLGKLFEVLNTPIDKRSTMLDEDLAAFPYINGGLFSEVTGMPDFDQTMRMMLIQTCAPDWSQVSPAIFGSMFQGVMNEEARHDVGAHYTSEENILRVIKPLFLDALYEEFESVKESKPKLSAFHDKLAGLGFIDPACGCGNFLVITYRELRRLEHRVLSAQMGTYVTLTDVGDLLKVRVEQMSGIEILEFPALIAQTALWLTDHQMNLEASARFGTHYARIPLTEGGHIVCTNALTVDWEDVRPADKTDYILSNPPFLGSRVMDKVQKAELRAVAGAVKDAGFLDYVAAWYIRADEVMAKNPSIQCALVSTSSISQGEQPGILWPRLLGRGEHINFAHRSFIWTNDARGVAKVHCVIVGFGRTERKVKQLFTYQDGKGEPVLDLVPSISPYLVPGGEFVVTNRQEQISGELKMVFGNMAADGGHLLLTREERDALIAEYPQTAAWIRTFQGADEFINRRPRYCLWLDGVSSGQIKAVPPVYERVREVREVREKSSRPQLANIPHLFAQRTQDPDQPFLLIPAHSSSRRLYVPLGFFEAGTVTSNSSLAIPNASLYHFGILTSTMHMDWMRAVCGRLKSDYRYSKDVVYNNFVFPNPTDQQRATLEHLAQVILDVRDRYASDSLADLYDDVVMPADLRSAHNVLDAYVDGMYNPPAPGFSNASDRVQYLLDLNRQTEQHRART
ncbi:N-6 DNA methylase [Pseudolysinimonas kribbensis]|uniref:site-specific DNA-methyltransferase (adenine-specific) n=1 Tax=Pseudolysinimonas kribbensis TaxID=433641 RepID=A0ABQ6K8A6_9MICO|nr:DNA methyltransferase [Pseudolysinimonas kribbensis]GMA96915.1 methylase [Pseudolysinimonas kribbensis]